MSPFTAGAHWEGDIACLSCQTVPNPYVALARILWPAAALESLEVTVKMSVWVSNIGQEVKQI